MKRSFEEDGSDNQKRVKTEGEANTPNRTIYIGSLHPSASIADICDLIQEGPLDQVRILTNKSCAFVSFIEDQAGIAAHARLSANPPSVYGKVTVIGWGASRPLPDKVAQAVAAGASRNVFIGGSVDRTSEEYLRDSLSRFGQIDCVDMLPAKKIAFVHFAAITSAIACKEALQADAQWKDFRLNYGKDRCCPDAKGRPHGASMAGAAVRRPVTHVPAPAVFGGNYPPTAGFTPAAPSPYATPAPAPYAPPPTPYSAAAAAPPPFAAYGGLAVGERTVYLGGVGEETNLKDVLDNVYGGMIDQVKILPEKKCCFISFVEPQAAQTFMAGAQQNGLFVNERPVKVGWGKTKPLPPAVAEALRTGATRNLFLGNIDPSLTAEKLCSDLGTNGRTIEKVDILATKKIAFVHFTSILSAIQAAEELKAEGTQLHAEYATYRVNYGKDRCATDRAHRPPKLALPALGLARPPPPKVEQHSVPEAYPPKGYHPEGGYTNPYPPNPSTWGPQ